MKKFFTLFHSALLMAGLTLCITSTAAFAQSRQLKGTVTDAENEPLAGVTVLVEGTTNGALTDMEGKFQLTVESDTTALLLRYVGFEEMRREVSAAESDVRLTLKEEALTMDAVMISAEKVVETRSSPASMSYSFSAPAATFRTTDVAVSGRRSPKRKLGKKSSGATHHWSTAAVTTPATSTTKAGTYSVEIADVGIADAPDAAAGLLTAGELQDFSKWELWKDIVASELSIYRKVWKVHPHQRYTLQFETEDGFPVADAAVTLHEGRSKKAIWKARTDNTGKAELWYKPFDNDSSEANNLRIEVRYQGRTLTVDKPRKFHDGINFIMADVDCPQRQNVDIAFVVDATGSMGDEIAFLKVELADIMKKVGETMPDLDVNLGAVFYRDGDNSYRPDVSALSGDHKQTIKFVNSQGASGGGDYPEAVEKGLGAAVRELEWREDAAARIVFLVLDAPPHGEEKDVREMLDLMAEAAEKGIRVVPVVGSGINKSTEFLMRSIALLTNGSYIFLTDDSGIGGAHIKPSTDEYEVETLNAILLRVIFQFTNVSNCEKEAPSSAQAGDTLLVYHPDIYKPERDPSAIVNSNEVISGDTAVVVEKQDDQISDQLIRWKYYPSPTTGIVHVQVDGQVGELFVTDMAGKILQRYMVPEGGRFDIDIAQFPAGVYFIKYAYGEDRWLSGKVVKVRY